MTITELVKNQQQQRIGELNQQRQGKPHVNPYGTPGMSLNTPGIIAKWFPWTRAWCSRSSRLHLTT